MTPHQPLDLAAPDAATTTGRRAGTGTRTRTGKGKGAAVCAVVLPTALLALQLGLGAVAQAQAQAPEPVGVGPRVASPRVASPLVVPDRATITEGQVKEVARGGAITYPSVTSCLTVTVRLKDGGLVGAHASLFQVPGELRSDRILAALKDHVGGRPVTAVEVRGAVGAWHPGYFVKAIESYGDGEQPPVPNGQDLEGIARAVSQGLGQPRSMVTVEDVPDGDQTVT
ncbi:hypothetical protein [Streptomyces sp. Je 1-369]|uniref:hypothetical protein n=1 Tax=Streptomyces sp. Je 1-369 TaxID=2966192 RepID=UPI0022869AC5|nr:hypothetical protein [Streptomyces sp. Je 1-369]WAL93289.1 hypothetical protein NOO62_01580 [Streptomyces sp. Je 1-369]